MSKTNRFALTINNYLPVHELLSKSDLSNSLKYWIFGREVGESGTPHLQGYIEFHNNQKLRITAAKQRLVDLGFPESIHLEPAKGTGIQNVTYCSKGGDFWQGGVAPKGQGKRTDLDNVCDLINSGSSLSDIAEQYPSQVIKFGQGITRLIQMKVERRFFKTEIFWLWGPTGSGKSRYAWDAAPTAYMKSSSHKWWDGYLGQETVILDDYRPSKEMPFNLILNLFDRYPLSVEIKGGMMEFTSKVIYVTSPFSPNQICDNYEWIGTEMRDQLLRRIDHVIQFPRLNALEVLMNH